MMKPIAVASVFVALTAGSALLREPVPVQQPSAKESSTVVAYVGATIIDGTGGAPIPNGVLVVEGGRIRAVGGAKTTVPAGAAMVTLDGKTMTPGLINAHGHITDVRGLTSSPEFYTPDHITHQLRLLARYGITTVFSLGGENATAVGVRDSPPEGTARMFVAGPVIAAATPDAARAAVDAVKALRADIVKIRVDDNLGATRKMAPEVYQAVIEQAHKQGLRVAAHIFYLQDAKDVLKAGGDFIAHSVRDGDVDAEFIAGLRARNVCVSPTLMREVSTFVYENRPGFLDDPFFRRDADPAAIEGVQTPQHQAANRTAAAARYKVALEQAKRNVKALKDAGVRIAMGTDSGPAARFQGYFEHLELEHMVSAGLTPMQVLVAATSDAAACMQVGDRLGTLKAGFEADFDVFARNPLDDIRHTRTLEAVYVRGRAVAMK
jgi:imidazolonepropionase-like amidohydrolase